MKNRRIVAAIVSVVAIIAILLTCTFALAACNKKPKGISDIFKNRSSYEEFTGYKTEFTLPAGWEVYTNSTSSSSSTNVAQYSDVGYIPELDAFVVSLKQQNGTTKLSVVKCGDNTDYKNGMMKGMMFAPSQGIRALRYKDGMIACLFDDGSAGVFDAASGIEIISRTKLGASSSDPGRSYGYSDTNNGNIDSIIKILCPGLVAVHYNYCHLSETGYTSIYRPTYTGAQGTRGELVCRIKNDSNNLSQVYGFDGKYASVSGTSTGEYMFRIPDHAPSEGPQSVEARTKGSFTTNNNTNYSDEATYIGGGKFYVSQDWEVTSGSDYTYYNGSKYIKCNRGVYNAENDTFSEYTGAHILNNITNNYYTSTKAGIDTKEYLRDGFSYVSFGLTIYEANGKKVGLYDQYIIDGNLNIVMSLTGNYGVTIKDQQKDKVGFYDLIMFGVDGVYYVPFQPSKINLFDRKGNLVGHNDRAEITRQELNGNFIVAQMPGESSSSNLYGAYDRSGELVVPFEYDMLASFRGLYTIGRRYGKKDNKDESTATRYLRLIGPNGKEVETAQMVDKDGNITEGKPFADIAHSSTSSSSVTNAIYKTGCYMFGVDSGERNSNNSIIYKYGIRNFNPNYDDSVIMRPTMNAGCVLYSPTNSPSNVFVFEKITGASSSDVTYVVYRLV